MRDGSDMLNFYVRLTPRSLISTELSASGDVMYRKVQYNGANSEHVVQSLFALCCGVPPGHLSSSLLCGEFPQAADSVVIRTDRTRFHGSEEIQTALCVGMYACMYVCVTVCGRVTCGSVAQS